jgi:hypothetical protein
MRATIIATSPLGDIPNPTTRESFPVIPIILASIWYPRRGLALIGLVVGVSLGLVLFVMSFLVNLASDLISLTGKGSGTVAGRLSELVGGRPRREELGRASTA